MSFAALNSPPLMATVGVSTMFGVYPLLESAVRNGRLSWTGIRAMNAVSYAFDWWATTRPGRIDSAEVWEDQMKSKNGSKKRVTSEEAKRDMRDLSPETGMTLVSPAGWAFAIWAPIFIGELVFVIAQFFVPESSPLASIITKLSAPFSAAHVFQSYWCATFRPKYTGWARYVSVFMLGSVAFCLSKAHAAYAQQIPPPYSTGEYCLHFLPMSLHFGWTTAATIVNLAGSHAKQQRNNEGGDGGKRAIAAVGHSCAIVATVAGVMLTRERSAPVYGGVISWALFAVAGGMKKRLRNSKKTDEGEGRPGVFGANVQKHLCTAGGVICAAASFVTAFSMSQR